MPDLAPDSPLKPHNHGVLAYALALSAPLMMTLLGLRLHKALRIAEAPTVAQVWAALAMELPLVAAWGAAVVVLVSLSRGRVQRAVVIALHGLTISLLMGLLIEHSFFLTSGALLDWQIVQYAWVERATLWGVYLAELQVWHGLFAALAVVITLLPWARRRRWLDDAPSMKQWLTNTPAITRLFVILVGMAGLAGLGISAEASHLSGRLALLRHSTFVGMTPLHAARNPLASGTVKSLAPAFVSMTARTTKRNVVIVMLESVRATSTTPYNAKLATTPFLAKLAAEGIVADRAYSVVPRTTHSMIALQCGYPPNIHHAFNEASVGALPGQCLPRMLRQMGYSTAYFQPTHLLYEKTRDLFTAFGYEHIQGRDDLRDTTFEEINYFGYEERAIIEPAVAWAAEQQDNHQPFLLSLMTNVAHHNYKVPKTWKNQTFSSDHVLNKYLNAVSYTDAFLHDLWAAFKQRGLLKNTLFVVIADHGEGFGEHGIFQHGVILYDEGSRIPFVLSGPWPKPKTGPAARRVGGLWQSIDVVPTVLDGLGLAVMGGWRPGRSLLRGEGHPRLYLGCWKRDRCAGLIDAGAVQVAVPIQPTGAAAAAGDDVKTKRVPLITTTSKGPIKTINHFDHREPEVFDLGVDPEEKHDLVLDKKVSKAGLKAQILAMKTWKEDVNKRYAEAAVRRRTSHVTNLKPELEHSTSINFAGYVRLIGTEIDRTRLMAGEAFSIKLAFEVLKTPPENWRLFMHIEGPDDYFGRLGHVPVNGSLPLGKWQPGSYVVDETWIPMDHHAPDGDFTLTFGLWDHKTNGLKRIKPVGEGLPIAVNYRVELGVIHVTNPKKVGKLKPGRGRKWLKDAASKAVTLASASTATQRAVFDKDIAWLGTTLSATHARSGDTIRLTHRFRALRDPPVSTAFFVHVVGPDGAIINASHTAVGGAYPVDHWLKGEQIVDVHEIKIGANRKPGIWRVLLGVYNPYVEIPFNRFRPQPIAPLMTPMQTADNPTGSLRSDARLIDVDDKRRLIVGEIEILAAKKTP